MKLGEVKIPEGEQRGETIVNFNDTVNIDPVVSHFTYHPHRNTDPAIVHLRTDAGDRLFEYSVEKLEDMEEFKRIFTIIPHDPNKFSIFQKKLFQTISLFQLIFLKINLFVLKFFFVINFMIIKNY